MSRSGKPMVVRSIFEEQVTDVLELTTAPQKFIGIVGGRNAPRRIISEGSTITNKTGSAVMYSMYILPTGGTADGTTVVASDVPLQAAETMNLPAYRIKPGYELWMDTDTLSAVNVYAAYGIEYTS